MKKRPRKLNPFYPTHADNFDKAKTNMKREIPVGYSIPKYKLATIYKELNPLIEKTKKLQFFMTRKDAQIYQFNAEKLILQALMDFIIAFDFQDERPHYYMKLEGELHAFSCIIDMIDGQNLIRTTNRMIDITNIQIPKNGEKLMMDIYEHIGKIDEDMTKWRAVAMRDRSSQGNLLK